jgi:hypothetical protein
VPTAPASATVSVAGIVVEAIATELVFIILPVLSYVIIGMSAASPIDPDLITDCSCIPAVPPPSFDAIKSEDTSMEVACIMFVPSVTVMVGIDDPPD